MFNKKELKKKLIEKHDCLKSTQHLDVYSFKVKETFSKVFFME